MKPLSYSPLETLGAQISRPGRDLPGLEFFKEHRRYISARYGSQVARDIAKVIEEGDFDAAIRVSRALCPDATFTVAIQGGKIIVDYVNLDDECPENCNEGQSTRSREHSSEAVALLGAAINFHATLVAEAEFALVRPELQRQVG
ncbi:hypothetical protein [Microvirga massiliensis]|uniref:hypothetical protein n=1 Tax=Microvirga massiliensis TaxID=1033741 RepID=UPI00062BCA6A|nr:hypothetical protein [Microvirga massiliensis]